MLKRLHISPTAKKIFKIIGFVVALVLAVWLINSFIFRFYSVVGTSMTPTLANGDVVFVWKVGKTVGTITQREFVPERGQLVVFKNPLFGREHEQEFIIKRVIGLPGERIVVKEDKIIIFNNQNPQGFNPDDNWHGPTSPTEGSVDRLVPDSELFVVGDNREARHSVDSRNGLSTLPLREIEGIAVWRILPLTEWRLL